MGARSWLQRLGIGFTLLIDPKIVIYSESDLTASANCEQATMPKLGSILGRVEWFSPRW